MVHKLVSSRLCLVLVSLQGKVTGISYSFVDMYMYVGNVKFVGLGSGDKALLAYSLSEGVSMHLDRKFPQLSRSRERHLYFPLIAYE